MFSSILSSNFCVKKNTNYKHINSKSERPKARVNEISFKSLYTQKGLGICLFNLRNLKTNISFGRDFFLMNIPSNVYKKRCAYSGVKIYTIQELKDMTKELASMTSDELVKKLPMLINDMSFKNFYQKDKTKNTPEKNVLNLILDYAIEDIRKKKRTQPLTGAEIIDKILENEKAPFLQNQNNTYNTINKYCYTAVKNSKSNANIKKILKIIEPLKEKELIHKDKLLKDLNELQKQMQKEDLSTSDLIIHITSILNNLTINCKKDPYAYVHKYTSNTQSPYLPNVQPNKYEKLFGYLLSPLEATIEHIVPDSTKLAPDDETNYLLVARKVNIIRSNMNFADWIYSNDSIIKNIRKYLESLLNLQNKKHIDAANKEKISSYYSNIVKRFEENGVSLAA